MEGDAPEGRRRRGHPVRWAVIGVAAVILLPAVVVLGSRLGEDPTLVRSVVVGKPAPDFALPNIDGGTVRSADLAGRPYVVNFWASWCVPCREEHRHLQAFYQRYRQRGVELLGIMFNDRPEDAKAFRAELGGDWPLLMDPKDRTAVDFGVIGVPETFVVDASGTIVTKFPGAVGPGSLEQVMAEIGFGDTGELTPGEGGHLGDG